MECFVPGRLLVGPDPEGGDSEYLLEELRDFTRGELDLDFSFAEILAANDISLKGIRDFEIPFVGRVPEGSEWDIADAIRKHPGVKAAMPDFTVRPSAGFNLNQASIDAGLNQIGGVPPGLQCGSGCKIAVLDTGVDPAKLGAANISPTQLDARNPNSALASPFDHNGHGTTVAGIISATAPGAEIMPIRVLDGTGSISNVLIGLYLARHGNVPCDLINLSLSIDCWSNSCSYCQARAAAVSQPQLEVLFAGALRGLGDVAVIAAGGKSTKTLAAPALFQDVIAVGSFDYDNSAPKSSFPNVPVGRYIMAPSGEANAK